MINRRVHGGDNETQGIGDDDDHRLPAREALATARASDQDLHREGIGEGAEPHAKGDISTFRTIEDFLK